MVTLPSISIVIPAYNYEALLPNAVASAAKQAIPNLEVLIVNDGSTDNTRQVAEQLASTFPNVRVLHKENGGASSARNSGIRNTNGEYLIFLDADDTLEPGALPKVMSAIRDFNQPLFIVCDHYNLDESGQKNYRQATKEILAGHSKSTLLKVYFKKEISLANGAVLMHRSVFDDISYNQTIVSSEDMPVWAFAMTKNKTVHIPIALNCVLTHSGSYRTEAWRVKQARYAPVDEFFAYPGIEQQFQHLKHYMYGRRALSIFRVLYRAHELKLARHYFVDAIKYAPELMLELNYLKKFTKSFFMGNQ